MRARFFLNQPREKLKVASPPSRAALDFHRSLPGYRATPLLDAPELARSLGIGQVLVKDESNRLSLPAFKILGASWAVYRVLVERSRPAGLPDSWSTFDQLVRQLAPLGPLTLVTATDGNH